MILFSMSVQISVGLFVDAAVGLAEDFATNKADYTGKVLAKLVAIFTFLLKINSIKFVISLWKLNHLRLVWYSHGHKLLSFFQFIFFFPKQAVKIWDYNNWSLWNLIKAICHKCFPVCFWINQLKQDVHLVGWGNCVFLDQSREKFSWKFGFLV